MKNRAKCCGPSACHSAAKMQKHKRAACRRLSAVGQNKKTNKASSNVWLTAESRKPTAKNKESHAVASKSKIAKAKRTPKFSTRRENRCQLCGRPRAVYQKFGICRICFRKLADQGLSPGVRNSSW